ncbi:MAG: amino acid adenylation domain-containing protein [Gammaproteobacteria bacterium]
MTRESASAKDKLGTFSTDRARLVKLLLEEKSRQTQRIKPRPRDAKTDVRLPTSWAQQRLWFIDQLEEGTAAYYIPEAVRLRGALDRDALVKALDALVLRHETLRTVFMSVDGDPHQLIAAEGRFQLREIDLSVLAEAECEAQVRLHKVEEAQGKFDLRAGPLIRGRLLKVSAIEHVLLVTMHHIVSDGWSMGVLIRELTQLYAALREGRGDPLQALPIQYADYAQWQRQWLQGDALEKQLGYWRERLQGAAPQLDLPTDRARPAVQSYRGQNVPIVLDARLIAALKRFAQRNEMTLFMVLYAAWALLLSRLSGQDDVVIGTPIANRQRPELEGLIGFFVNALALRVSVPGDIHVKEFLEQVRNVTLEAYDHQDVPFEKVVEALRPERSLSRNPLFQVAFALQSTPQGKLCLPGLTATVEQDGYEAAIFDLLLSLEERGDQVVGGFYYAADLFDQSTIERWTTYFNVLLKELGGETHSRVRDLPMLPETERHQVTELFTAAHESNAPEKLIHELFEAQVARTPNAVAVLYEQQSLTYAELNGKANQLARHLKALGVGPDQLVALCMERSLEMVVGVLGILKAGGAYVPLDPDYPPERLAYMVEDAAPKLLLTQERLREDLPSMNEVVALDSDWSQIEAQPSSDLGAMAGDLRPAHLAYVIYTSGSTGKPKGVMVEHRNVTRLFASTAQWFSFNERDVWTLFHSIAFDFSVWELWGALLYGGRVVVVPYLTVRSPQDFYRLLCDAGVTVLNQTPSAFAQLIEAQEQCGDRKQSLRVVIFGGEALELRTLRPWVARNGVARPRLVNMYGITETTVHVTYRPLTAQDIESARCSPVGNAIPDLRVYLLDRYRNPVPIGVVGEMYVGGAGVARGYLNRPALTAERFIPDLFSADPLARLYKTGDLGRWNTDGTLDYAGRNDQQVKIRGYRIELGEIETLLANHAQVKDAVVLLREDVSGEKRLVAYVVGERDGAVTAESDGAFGHLHNDIVNEWETLYEQTYGLENHVGPSFIGWNSSYTGQPIPEPEMQEWLACTVERILALKPRKMLEIGCGMGLLLQHLAPRCDVYLGTDISKVAIAQLRQWMSGRQDLRNVELRHRPATQLRDIEPASFDTVVINSVAQYFPDIDYLLAVLREAVRLLRGGGKIFLGDIRHLGLLTTFHSAVQLGKAAETVSVGQLRSRIARALTQDKELVIDPQFFLALPGRVRGISAATVQLKRGHASNELTRYRYDVVLEIGEEIHVGSAVDTLPWLSSVGSIEGLEAALGQRRWEAVRLSAIPNERVAGEAAAQALLQTSEERLDVGSLRHQVSELVHAAVDPDTLWRLGEAHGYDVQVTCGPPESHGSMEALLLHRDRADKMLRARPASPLSLKPWSAYANDPVETGLRQQLIPQLRDYLKARLPEYMLPSAWMVLRQLPLTPNGKLDRRTLPGPHGRPDEIGEYIAPRTRIERTLAEIWAQVLRVDQVGLHDNFFDLGGHSLLATRVISRIGDQLQIELPLRVLFDAPTVEKLALRVSSEGDGQAAKEALRVRDLTHELRGRIDEMQDDAILARIAELEREATPAADT